MVDAVNDDEQLERLKEWWQQNWLPLVLGLGLAVSGVLGWKFWEGYQRQQAELASGHFEHLQVALQVGEKNKVLNETEKLKSEFRGTPYAAQAALLVARLHMDNNEPDAAASQLEWVSNYADDSKLQHVAKLRLAKVRWSQGKTDEALALLEEARLDSFTGIFAELRGDILASLKRNKEARQAYKEAMQTADVSDLAAIQQKLADLVTESGKEALEGGVGEAASQ